MTKEQCELLCQVIHMLEQRQAIGDAIADVLPDLKGLARQGGCTCPDEEQGPGYDLPFPSDGGLSPR